MAVFSAPAFAAPVDICFQGTLAFDLSGSFNLDNVVAEVEAAVLSILHGASIQGRFTYDAETPLEESLGSSTDPGQTAIYADASTDLAMSLDGMSFVDDDPATCRVAFQSLVCDARQSNDCDLGPGLEPFDSLPIASDLTLSDDLTLAIEAESGVSATVVGPGFSFLQSVVGSVGFCAADFGLLPVTDLASLRDMPAEDRTMSSIPGIPDVFAMDPNASTPPRYFFDITNLPMSDTPPAVPVPMPALLLASGIGAMAALRRRQRQRRAT